MATGKFALPDPSGGGIFSEDEEVELEDCAAFAGIDLALPLAFFLVGGSSVVESLLCRRLPSDLAEGITGTDVSSTAAVEAAWGPWPAGCGIGGITIVCKRLLGRFADC